MDRIFSTHGLPVTVKSDDGPPFTSEEVKKYMEESGINHHRITPLWPQANSEVEAFDKGTSLSPHRRKAMEETPS